MRKTIWSVVVLAGVCGSSAMGQTVSFSSNSALSTENTGASYEGTMEYDAVLARLSISLTNTSPGAVGGRLTAFAFRFDTVDQQASAALVSSSLASFTDTGSGVNAAPFGQYAGGAGLGGSFLGGGNPNPGLAIGASGIWVFDISASDASLLSTYSFLSDPTDLVARFRGLSGGGSDKVPVTMVPDPDAPPVPAPGPLALALTGGALACRRWKR